MSNLKQKKGFTLIEMIVYISILSTLLVVVVNTILILSSSYASIKLANDINNSASVAMERLIGEIRFSSSINVAQSTLGSHPGRLFLNKTDSSGLPTTIDFFVDNGLLKLNKAGLLSGSLVRDNIEVSNLVFRQIDVGVSYAIKIELQLRGTEGKVSKTENFYSTVVLRDSY